MKIINGILLLIFLFVIPLLGIQKIDKLIQQKKYPEAESYCAGLKKKNQKDCYRQLGDAYFHKGNYRKAGNCYEKSDYKQGFNQIGQIYFDTGDFFNSVQFYEKGVPSGDRAYVFLSYAEDNHFQKKYPIAKIYYNKAVLDYEFLLKNFFYDWKDEYFSYLKRCYFQWNQMEKTPQELAEKKILDKVLKGTEEYCSKMKNWAFHFFCKEEITEHKDYSQEVEKGFKVGHFGLPVSMGSMVVDNKFIYEYQLIQEKNHIQETRTLLKKNGVKRNVPNAKLSTHGYKYEKLIFGPLALISEFWQDKFYYRYLGKEILWDEKAFIIEAIPFNYYPKNNMFGKIWISEKDFSVLKIKWYPKSLGITQQVEEYSRLSKSEPTITFYAEFKYNKKGIRFPSRYYLEEAYINKKGKKKVRLKQDVILKDYMFFVVGTEVQEAKPKLH